MKFQFWRVLFITEKNEGLSKEFRTMQLLWIGQTLILFSKEPIRMWKNGRKTRICQSTPFLTEMDKILNF
jgi:hypothetical protein